MSPPVPGLNNWVVARSLDRTTTHPQSYVHCDLANHVHTFIIMSETNGFVYIHFGIDLDCY